MWVVSSVDVTHYYYSYETRRRMAHVAIPRVGHS